MTATGQVKLQGCFLFPVHAIHIYPPSLYNCASMYVFCLLVQAYMTLYMYEGHICLRHIYECSFMFFFCIHVYTCHIYSPNILMVLLFVTNCMYTQATLPLLRVCVCSFCLNTSVYERRPHLPSKLSFIRVHVGFFVYGSFVCMCTKVTFAFLSSMYACPYRVLLFV